ncbi:MAG TPA: hypothetical protein PLQ95_11260 [Thiobacillus sp.]|nr:hypothetical protein [Thiobacillus sp.]
MLVRIDRGERRAEQENLRSEPVAAKDSVMALLPGCSPISNLLTSNSRAVARVPTRFG